MKSISKKFLISYDNNIKIKDIDYCQEYNKDNNSPDVSIKDIIPLFQLKKEYLLPYQKDTCKKYIMSSNFYYCLDTNTNSVYVKRNDIDAIIVFLNDYINGYPWQSMSRILKLSNNTTVPKQVPIDIFGKYFDYLQINNFIIFNKTQVDEYYQNLINFKDIPFIVKQSTSGNGVVWLIYEGKILDNLLLINKKDDIFETIKSFPIKDNFSYIIDVLDYGENEIVVDNKTYLKITHPYIKENLKFLSRSTIRTFYKDYISQNNIYYINKDEVETVVEKHKNTIPLKKLYEMAAKKIGMTFENKMFSKSLYSLAEFFDDGVIDFFQAAGYQKEKVYFYQTNDKEKETNMVLDIIIDNHLSIPKDYIPYIEYKFDYYCYLYPDKTNNINLYKKYILNDKKLINTYKSTTIINLLGIIVKDIDKDIKNLTTNDILLLNNENTTFESRRLLKYFLEYIKQNFNVEFETYSLINTSIYKQSQKDIIYTKEEWEQLIVYLVTIDNHLKKAIENDKYARMWLFSLMGISVAWRTSDIINLPQIDFMDCSIFDLDWFTNNDFTIGYAQQIINQYSDYANRTLIEKTHEQKHFIVPNAIVIPFAIALVLVNKIEKKKGKNENNNIFGTLTPFNVETRNEFNYKNLDIINTFTMQKANRSFITYGNEYASHSVKFSYGGYALLSQSRGHKLDETGLSDTTSIYIKSTDNDGTIDDISLGMFNRGIFGWLYYTILKMTTNVDKLQFCDINYIISSIKNELDAFGIENISGWINNEALSRQEIIKKLVQIDNNDLIVLLVNIQSKNNISKTNNILCSITNTSEYCSSKVCINPLSQNCTLCKYSIPTTYVLTNIGKMTIEILEKINNLKSDDILHKQMYANHLLKMLSIIGQAKIAFKDFGNDYLESYLKLNQIKSLLVQSNLLKGEQ